MKIREILFDTNGIILFGSIAVLTVLFTILTDNFLTWDNFVVIIESMAILTFLALGVNFLLVGGEISISFGAVLEFSAVVTALASHHFGAPIVIAAGIVAGIGIGALNGFFAIKMGIPSFLVTLASMIGVGGAVYILSNYTSVILESDLLIDLFYTRHIGNISMAVFWAIGAIVAVGIFLSSTRYGSWIYKTGGNEEAARLMGIPTKKIKFSLFVLCGVMASIAGLLAVARSAAGRAGMGAGFMMPAISASILGGSSLTGGRGSTIRTAVACFLLTLIINGVNLLGLEPAFRDLFMGAILLLALSARHFLQK